MSEPAADQNENIDVPLREGEQPVEHMSWRLSRRIRRPLFSGYDNVLLVFVPIGIAAGTFGWPAEAVFVLNFLAIIPLAPLITFSIDGLSPALGRTFGELLRPTSGNAAEMIVRCLFPFM
jgi:Ca2+:H+ antiporter